MTRIKRFISAFLICAVVSAFTGIYSFAADIGTGTVTGSVVNVRKGPGTSYSIITQVARGNTVTVISQESGWYKIRVNGKEGYMIGDYLSVNSGQASVSNNETIYGIVTGSVVNVRKGPGTSYGIISQVKKGASITITATLDGWYKIDISGKEGYICSDYVSTSSSGGSGSIPAETRKGIVTGSVVNVRTGAGTSYGIITQVKKGTSLTIIGQKDEWYKISINGTEGYISSYYVNADEDNSETQSGTITGSVVNFRKGPSTTYGSQGLLLKGTVVTVRGTEGDWVKIEYNGATGYVYSAYISIGAEKINSSVTGDEILEYASQFIGVPYLYGGSTPLGFDCSGLTQYVYKHFGISIPRTAASQYSAYPKVSRDQLQKGDLVFFTGPGSSSIQHVGIYAGDGKFIDAPSSGKYVRYDSLYSTYYNTYYYGAVRVLH